VIQQIFVNLPVRDLARSVHFFSQLGFSFDARFTDENATCMILGENIYAMLLVEKFFQTFTPKPVADATRATEVLVSLAVPSRGRVAELVARAERAGASLPRPPQDHGFMFQHGFHDLDGHVWEIFWMDPAGPGSAS
jgi:predicted lactoylglutathione lyase